jgi:hypothetical protein
MSIPEVSSRARLVAFLRKFFAPLTATWQAPSLLPYGYAASMSAPFGGRDAYTVDGIDNGGYRMMTSGSIVGVSCQFDCTAYSSDTEFRATIRKNGSAPFASANASVIVTGTGDFGANATFAPNIYGFVPGDLLEVRMSHGAAGITTENHVGLMRILSSTG